MTEVQNKVNADAFKNVINKRKAFLVMGEAVALPPAAEGAIKIKEALAL